MVTFVLCGEGGAMEAETQATSVGLYARWSTESRSHENSRRRHNRRGEEAFGHRWVLL